MFTRREFLATTAAATLKPADAHPTDVYRDGAKSPDVRLKPPKTLNDYFPFAVPKTLQEWEIRRKKLREQLLVANGLWPMPPKTPLNPMVHGKVERDGFTVEKVAFASTPGHYVTGNLYRPTSAGKHAAVLFAHGHFADGRFHDAGENAAKEFVRTKQEADLLMGRLFMQALPTTLAKLGFVVFQYDMVGYADSTAIPHIARSGVPHAEGFADAEGELRLQSLMGLQTLNSVRALDFLCGLPDVDAAKIGITGASGGGTQTFILAAIDDRIAAAFPAVMVSTGMQGGCICENCSLLRVGTGNVELAALFAPKPLAMSAANDWTKEILTKGLPELKQLYALYGKPENVAAKAWTEYPHNYNKPAREFMYEWFCTHLQSTPGPVAEPAFAPVEPRELAVFDLAHPRPKDELGAKALRASLTAISDVQMAKQSPDIIRAALQAMVGGKAPWPYEIEARATKTTGRGQFSSMHLYSVQRKGDGRVVPTVMLHPSKPQKKLMVLWIHPAGKRSLFDGDVLCPAALALVEADCVVVAPDLFGVGEQAHESKPNKIYAGFTYGYNLALAAERVWDIVTVMAEWLPKASNEASRAILGFGAFGPLAVVAQAAAGMAVGRTVVDLNQFDFAKLTDPGDAMMLPGALKYGGLPKFLELALPGRILAHNHTMAAPKGVTVQAKKLADIDAAVWLMQ